jgi:hypothetical protein
MPLNEKNMAVLNSILEEGFMFIDENDQPKNINQVISFLLKVSDGEGYLKSKTSVLFDKIERKEDGGFK